MASSQFYGNMRPQYMRDNLPGEDSLSHEMSAMSLSNNNFGSQYGLQEAPNDLNPDAIEFRSGRANHFTKQLMKDLGGRSNGGGKKARRTRQYKERSERDLSPSSYQPPMQAVQQLEPLNLRGFDGTAMNVPGHFTRGRAQQPRGYQLHEPHPMQGQHQMPYYGNPFQGDNMQQAPVPIPAHYQSHGWNQRPGPISTRGQPAPMFLDGSYQRQQ